MEKVKIGTIEITEQEASEIYGADKLVVTSTGVWQVCYSAAQKAYYAFRVVIIKGLAKRGKYFTATNKEVEKLLAA